jgi:hypothetical protein|tara:strand:- start:14678 stop:15076 length:399 start_codon:yes stop_codon:yes gene_type:complete
MSEIVHKASCMCGDIQIEAGGNPNYAEYCHCITCQKSSGSSFMVWVVFDKEKVNVTKGEISLYNSSPELQRGFCSNCGSNVSIHTDKCFDLPIGVLERPDDIKITQHIWAKRALKHVNLEDGLPCYDEGAPD